MFLRWDKSEKIVACIVVTIALFLYFSPLSISERYRNSVINFEASDYLPVEESRFSVLATITLQSPENSSATGVGCLVQLEIRNQSATTVQDFRWLGRLDEGVFAFTSDFPFVMYLNDPGVYGSYSMLLQQLLRTKYDLLPQGSPKVENRPGSRRLYIPGLYSSYQSGISVPAELGGLDGLIEQLQKPIRLKMLYQGGCDYVQVVPTVVNNVEVPGK